MGLTYSKLKLTNLFSRGQVEVDPRSQQLIVNPEHPNYPVALLRILALGNRQIEEGRITPAATAINRLRNKKVP